MKGDAKDLVGNPCNYFSMNKYTKHPEACVEFLKMLYSDKCVEDQLKAGNLPATSQRQRDGGEGRGQCLRQGLSSSGSLRR